MTITEDELQSFSRFVAEKMTDGCSELTLEECLRIWRTSQLESADLESIQRGIEDAEAGRLQPLDEVADEIRKEHGLPVSE